MSAAGQVNWPALRHTWSTPSFKPLASILCMAGAHAADLPSPHLRVVVAGQVQQLVVHQLHIVGSGRGLGAAGGRRAAWVVG